MTRCEWIVCERAPRWAPALRTEFANRAASTGDATDRSPQHEQVNFARREHSLAWSPRQAGFNQLDVTEVRGLAELDDRIADATNFVAFVEVTRTNLDAVLSWLATRSRGTGFAVVAALDRDLKTPIVAAALCEAGAIDVAGSPRRLKSAIRIGLLYTATRHRSKPMRPAIGQSFEEWARSLLPWQVAH